jgi:hypothetical protein
MAFHEYEIGTEIRVKEDLNLGRQGSHPQC